MIIYKYIFQLKHNARGFCLVAFLDLILLGFFLFLWVCRNPFSGETKLKHNAFKQQHWRNYTHS